MTLGSPERYGRNEKNMDLLDLLPVGRFSIVFLAFCQAYFSQFVKYCQVLMDEEEGRGDWLSLKGIVFAYSPLPLLFKPRAYSLSLSWRTHFKQDRATCKFWANLRLSLFLQQPKHQIFITTNRFWLLATNPKSGHNLLKPRQQKCKHWQQITKSLYFVFFLQSCPVPCPLWLIICWLIICTSIGTERKSRGSICICRLLLFQYWVVVSVIVEGQM